MYTNRLKAPLLSIFVLMLITSCQWFSKKSGEVNRSLLMYLVVTSNLNSSISSNMSDIKNSPFLPEYFDVEKESGNILLVMEHKEGDIPRLKRLYRDEFGEVHEEIIQEYEGRSSIEPELLHEVLTYTNSVFPAKESGILFSSHGTGWTPEGYYANPKSVKSFGQMDKREMDIMEMAEAIPGKYSYMIMDACLMGSVEVAYELKDATDYLLLSPAEIMAAGMPYGDIMEQVFYTEGEVGKRMTYIAASYFDYYSDRSTGGGTITLVRSDKLAALGESVKAILDKDRDKIAGLDMSDIQPYFRGTLRHWFYDLTDFMEHISTDPAGLDKFHKAMDDAVVAKYATEKFLSIPIKKYSGLSTYISNPADSYLDSYYKKLAWNKAVQMVR